MAASVLLAAMPLRAQPGSRAAAETGTQGHEELIAVVRTNGVERGEFTVLRDAGGDFLVQEADLQRMKVRPVPAALRTVRDSAYYSVRALGAIDLRFDQDQLAVDLAFPAEAFERTQLDLANRPPRMPASPAPTSLVVNYRASGSQAGDGPLQLRLATELNLRVGPVVLRQEYRYAHSAEGRRLVRGVTQLLRDDRENGTRWTVGDQIVRGDAFGTAFTAAGVSFARLFTITPELIRQPTAAARVSALGPSVVEVSVDGSPVYRANVGPGPIDVENLFWYGGARTVRVTVTDAAGRRQVFEQPYLFTESVLAVGLHEFSYFVGRRSTFGADDSRQYLEGAWQGFHRYGATDNLTFQAGGEGSKSFATLGVGATARHQHLGVLGLDLLGSHDRRTGRQGHAVAARYTYLAPWITAVLAHRRHSANFTTYADVIGGVRLQSETRVGVSAPVGLAATLSADLVRARDANGARWNAAARLSTALSRTTTLQAEVTRAHGPLQTDWAVNLFLRHELDNVHWVSATTRADGESRSLDMEVGRQVNTGEGLNYRLGTTTRWRRNASTTVATAATAWNLRPVRLELNGASQLHGGRSTALELAAAGSVVAMPDYWGLSRPIPESFAVARLGVPHEGVQVFLNNVPQGRTRSDGTLLIPQLAAYGRQEIALNEADLPIDYSIRSARIAIAPGYKSGVLVDFAGRTLRAFTGPALAQVAGERQRIASRAWTLQGPGGRVALETTREGDFYLEDVAPGRYTGELVLRGERLTCVLDIPESKDIVTELPQGVLCD